MADEAHDWKPSSPDNPDTARFDDLVIKVRGDRGHPEKVDVKLPLPVVDALLSGPDDELNFVAAVRALKESGDGELVAVTDRSTVVRIWIDGKNGSE